TRLSTRRLVCQMGSRWVHGERHLPRYRERSRHRSAQLPRRLCRTISKSCSWPLRVLSLGSCATSGLLRARRERPRGRAADKRDELVSPHWITSSARASNIGGTVRPIAFAAIRLIASSNLVGCSTGKSPGFAPRRILSTY